MVSLIKGGGQNTTLF